MSCSIPRKILIVDDESDTASAFDMILQMSRYEVDSFIDPITALKNHKVGLYDLLILDMKMPKMDGFELYDEIKKIYNKAKVCFLTASEMYYSGYKYIFLLYYNIK
ncbi:MAG: response regulator [Nitrososphaeraceae archaeon]